MPSYFLSHLNLQPEKDFGIAFLFSCLQFQECFKEVSRKFKECFKEVSGECFKKVSTKIEGGSRVFERIFKGVSGMFQWCFRKFQRSFKEVLRDL